MVHGKTIITWPPTKLGQFSRWSAYVECLKSLLKEINSFFVSTINRALLRYSLSRLWGLTLSLQVKRMEKWYYDVPKTHTMARCKEKWYPDYDLCMRIQRTCDQTESGRIEKWHEYQTWMCCWRAVLDGMSMRQANAWAWRPTLWNCTAMEYTSRSSRRGHLKGE